MKESTEDLQRNYPRKENPAREALYKGQLFQIGLLAVEIIIIAFLGWQVNTIMNLQERYADLNAKVAASVAREDEFRKNTNKALNTIEQDVKLLIRGNANVKGN